MSATEILLSVLLGLLVNECCDVSPWLARRIVVWSVRHRYASDPDRAAARQPARVNPAPLDRLD